jgi:ubiquinone/menaquinone biosynthesis C-methylase UbiE
MKRHKTSAAKRYHDRVAPRYDDSYNDAFWQWHDTMTWDHLKPYLPRDLSLPVVDLGCGTGKWASKLAKSGFRVTCIDLSHQMLDQARRKLEHQGDLKRAVFVQADLCELGAVPDAEFALAVAFGDPIGSTSSPARALKETRRILRPEGVLVATFDNKLSAVDFYLQKGDAKELARFLRRGVTHWLTRDPDEQFPIHTYSPQEVVKLVESAGFQVIELLGKTVLPMRHYRHLLETSESRRIWAAVEKRLCRDRDALVLASHIQVACVAA